MPLASAFRPLILTALMVLTNCAAALDVRAGENTKKAMKPLIIFAASSLTAPLRDIAKAYEQDTGQPVTLSFGSSSSLARQLSMGAPGRVFISAHKKWVTWLQENNKQAMPPALSIAQNGLVLASRTDVAKRLGLKPDQPWDDYLTALGPNRLIVGQPTTVPLGQYTMAYLENNGLWHRVKDQLAPARDALGAVMLLKSGQSPLAIIYQNDATYNDDLVVLKYLYKGKTSPIHYYALKVESAQAHGNKKAQEFLNYLTTEKAGNIFCNHGLTAKTCSNMEHFQ